MGDKVKGDSLGDRMKGQYEDRTRYLLPRRTFTILRLDGKAFHAYTRQLQRPYDLGFMGDMDAAAAALCEQAQGAACAYVQSDEISVLLADFATITTEAWFDAGLQKLVSVSASIVTAAFNARRPGPQAHFDCRAFTIPDRVEVGNYFVWRQQDATRNSINMAAETVASHRELMGIDSKGRQEILHRHGINWNDYPLGFKRGRMVVRHAQEVNGVVRHDWRVDYPPVFTQERAYLDAMIPGREPAPCTETTDGQ
jgi:tRNA(His) guanylyltransferase